MFRIKKCFHSSKHKPFIVFTTFSSIGGSKNVLVCTFYEGHMDIFEISVKKTDFLIPLSTYSREKKFSSLRRDNEPFWELKRSKMEESAQNFRKRYYININRS